MLPGTSSGPEPLLSFRGLGSFRRRSGGAGCGRRAAHQLLDLILGSPRSAVQDLGRVRFVEHVAQLDEGGEVQSAVGEVFGDDGKTRQQPRGRGATKCRRLGESDTIGS
jgi:hypothetical protein